MKTYSIEIVRRRDNSTHRYDVVAHKLDQQSDRLDVWFPDKKGVRSFGQFGECDIILGKDFIDFQEKVKNDQSVAKPDVPGEPGQLSGV